MSQKQGFSIEAVWKTCMVPGCKEEPPDRKVFGVRLRAATTDIRLLLQMPYTFCAEHRTDPVLWDFLLPIRQRIFDAFAKHGLTPDFTTAEIIWEYLPEEHRADLEATIMELINKFLTKQGK